ncbi:TPA: hypothetical protein N0F65_008279 [Lagenidium giganteum]|uniref:Uncharacterized protein n=1 Tax=Lagenidium giganteum TaxID=4803 RepID=A0AAV2YU79_9STRA|nr:TPA: hypothetical protein N0F65_008279 [Lagenidium giganteum]
MCCADYQNDAKTTYCYWVKQGLGVQKLDASYIARAGKDDECPMQLTIAQTTTGKIQVNQVVEYMFEARLNLARTTFNVTKLYTVPDATGRPNEIAHANIHTCSKASKCDVFNDGTNRKVTEQEMYNFTNNAAQFRHKIKYDHGGDYNVFAHLILPTETPSQDAYHFMIYTTTSVEADKPSDSGGMSSGALVGIIVGGAVVVIAALVAFVFFRRKKPTAVDQPYRHSGGNYPPSGQKSRVDWNGDMEYRWKDNHSNSQQGSQGPPPSLSAHALAYHERQTQATLSSNGSPRSQRAPPPYHAVTAHQPQYPQPQPHQPQYAPGMSYQQPYVTEHKPQYVASGYSSPTGTTNTIQMPTHQRFNPTNVSSEFAAYGATKGAPSVDTFVHPSDQTIYIGGQRNDSMLDSFESEVSMGTELGFASREQYESRAMLQSTQQSGYPSVDAYQRPQPRSEFQSELMSSMNSRRSSNESMGTVDFTMYQASQQQHQQAGATTNATTAAPAAPTRLAAPTAATANAPGGRRVSAASDISSDGEAYEF